VRTTAARRDRAFDDGGGSGGVAAFRDETAFLEARPSPVRRAPGISRGHQQVRVR